jgi:outer membrane protein TolC
MRKTGAFFASFAFLLARSLSAADSGRPLPLAEATALSLAKNHDIALERESFHIADANVLKADGSYDPSFHLDGGYRDHTDPVNSILSGAPAGELAPTQSGSRAPRRSRSSCRRAAS